MRGSLSALIIGLLGIVMVAALALSVPDGAALTEFGGQALVYALLTTLSLYFGVLLTEGEFSPAHTMGMVAFLTLPAASVPVMTWAMFIGGAAGGVLLVIRTQQLLLRRRVTARTMRSVVVISARMVLSFVVAAEVYRALGGITPLPTPLRDAIIPLFGFSAAYCLVYLAIYALETYHDGRPVGRVLRENALLIGAILLLPIPFGVAAALLITFTPSSFVTFIIGASLVGLGVHWLSLAQYQMRKQVDEMRSLTAFSQALQSDLKINSLLYAIYNQVAQLLPIDQFVAALYERETRRLTFPLAIKGGRPIPYYSETGDKTLLGRVLTRQNALLISRDVAGKAREMGLEPPPNGVHSWVGVPLLAGGRLLGAMAVTSSDPQQTFGPDDLRLLNIVAASAGVAIDNALLYEQQMSRANQLTTLNRILSLLTGTLSPDEVMDAVISSATVIAEATAVAVYLFWDEEQSTLALVRSGGLSDEFTGDPPPPLLTDYRQRPILIHDIHQDKRAAPYLRVMTRENKTAWAEMPLAVGDTGLGTLVMYFDRPQEFKDDDVEIMRAFANQAAQAIKNARQYTTTDKALERRADQMYALATLGRQLTATMNLRSICNLVLSRAMEMSSATAGFIALQDENNEATAAAQSGYPPALLLNDALIRQSATGRVLASGQPARINDVRGDSGDVPLLRGTRSLLSVPILRSGSILGAITLESDQVGAFGEEDSNFVTQLANQTVIAIDNTRLFERIAEARDRLQVILNAMTEGIVLIDRSGTVALANPRVDLIGLKPNQLLNNSMDELLERPELDLAERMGFQSDQKVRKLLKELKTPGGWIGSEPVAYIVENDQGGRHIQRQVIPVGGNEPIGMLFVFYDETEEKELSQMRDDLSNMIVHDLRSPLTAVTTGLKLLRDIVPVDNPLRPMIETTTETSSRAIRKLLSRVDSLLDISKMESGQMTLDTEPTDLATLADSVCMELSPLAHELDVTLTSHIDDRTPTLDIDADKVERVLQNLVDNALKFCPADGSVTLQTHEPETVDGKRFVRVDVADTGPGVPEEYKQRLFDRFVQVKGRRGARRGIGLGLTFCRMVVEAHGGRIWIEDNPGGGSIFSFTLPISTATGLDETGEYPAMTTP